MYSINTLLCPLLFVLFLNELYDSPEQTSNLHPPKTRLVRLANQEDRLNMLKKMLNDQQSFWNILSNSTDVYNDSIATFDDSHVKQVRTLFINHWDSYMPTNEKKDLIQQFPGIEGIIHGTAHKNEQAAFSRLLAQKINEKKTTLLQYKKQHDDCVKNTQKNLNISSHSTLTPFIKTHTDLQALWTLQRLATLKNSTL